jgi:hypothetical protein
VFKKLYWVAMLILLFVLPGISIIMFVLYLGWGFLSLFFGGGNSQQKPSTQQAEASADVSDDSVQQPSAEDGRKIAEEFSSFASQIDLEHEEQQRLDAENATHHREAIEEPVAEEPGSWQEQLEADARH